ncbi:MAG: hypothetical protein M3O71_21320 [Bacteroidota bacterium]|nr:hypothetical protein [Bacteroidota bacterium]
MKRNLTSFFGIFSMSAFCKKGFRFYHILLQKNIKRNAPKKEQHRYGMWLMLFFCLFGGNVFGQRNTLDIAGMHQLISQSQDENKLQVKAKNQQIANTAKEQANLTLLAKLKNTYRTLQERYNTLGTAINVADIGIYATPMVRQIISYQGQIISLTQKNPVLIPLGLQTEIAFAAKAKSLAGYIAGLSLSIGDVNQMKASDRKMLFDYVISELSAIQELSGKMVQTLQTSSLNSIIRSINPFQNYIDKDKMVAEDIIFNAKYLKQ